MKNKIVILKLDNSTELTVEADYYKDDHIFEIFDIQLTKGTITDLLLWIDRYHYKEKQHFHITDIDEMCWDEISNE